MPSRKTLARTVEAKGPTLHAGVAAVMALSAAPPETGIVFRRTDRGGAIIPALWSNVAETRLGTVVRKGDVSVSVIEHLMAALAGAGIDDCIVDIDADELPILDGDALSFLALIDRAGTREQHGEAPIIRVQKPVGVETAAGTARLLPAPRMEYDFEIAFEDAIIGQQHFLHVFTQESFRRDIAPARTFGFARDADALRAAGYGRGATLDNTLVVDGDRLLNPGLMRFADEFVRHKILDAIGDLALAGARLVARYEGVRASHTLNNALLRALFSDAGNYATSASA